MAVKVKLKMVEPIRMNSTKQDSRAVDSRPCLSCFMSSLPRENAISMPPTAPIAPPSVGVATPRKIVPSTRKISASGGISTKVTRSVMRDSRPMPVTLLTMAATKANRVPPVSATTMVSSAAGVTSEPFSADRISP